MMEAMSLVTVNGLHSENKPIISDLEHYEHIASVVIYLLLVIFTKIHHSNYGHLGQGHVGSVGIMLKSNAGSKDN